MSDFVFPILGLIVSGVLFTTLAMSPLPNKYPYERFDPTSPKPNNPNKVFLNVDGFITGLFSTASNGSLSGKRSFAAIHPDYLDQLFLNRIPKDVSKLTSNIPAISVPIENAVWPAPDTIKSQIEEFNTNGELNNSPGRPSGSYVPTIVRVGIKKAALRSDSRVTAGKFTPSQLRLICKRSTETQDPLTGEAINVYPVGHLSSATQMQVTKEIQLESRNYGDATTKEIDFVFCVPTGYTPVLVQFKLNSVAQIRQNEASILKDASLAPRAATYTEGGGGQRGGFPGGGGGQRGGFPGGGGQRGGFPDGGGQRGGFPGGGGFPGDGGQSQDTPQGMAEQLMEPINNP